MNENLNLTEILKDAPRGTKLWSPICGDCILDKIDATDTTIVYAIHCLTVNDHSPVQFTANGKYTLCFDDGECALFPSKDNRDWQKFEVQKKHKEFKPYQRVLVREWFDCKSIWTASLYSHYDDALDRHCLLGFKHVEDNEIIPYEGNENKLGNIIR